MAGINATEVYNEFCSPMYMLFDSYEMVTLPRTYVCLVLHNQKLSDCLYLELLILVDTSLMRIGASKVLARFHKL